MERIESPSKPSSSRRARRVLAALLLAFVWRAGVAAYQAPTGPTPSTQNIQPPGAYQIIIGGAPPRFAIPDCVPRGSDAGSTEACATIGQVLRDDLRFEGLFDFVTDRLVASLPKTTNFDAPNLMDWKGVDAGVLVLTSAEATGTNVAVEIKVYDVNSGAVMLAKQYSGRRDNPRLFAHRASDDIMTLTQYKGVARSRVAFATDRDGGGGVKEIYLADYDGFNPRRLTVTRSLNLFPSWSVDGKTVAYVSYRNFTASILRAFLYEGRSENLTKSMEGNFAAPSFSPDGRKIAYAAMRGGNAEIMIASADGSGAHRITSSPGVDTAPCWSPTGREIAFTSDRSGAQRVWVMDEDGLNVRRLTGVDSDAPSWNPSKEFSEIAFTARLEGSFQIAVYEIETGRTRQVSEGMGSCEYPSWSPNGRHLIFACQKGGRWQLTLSDRIGKNVRTLAMPGNNVYPDWGP